MKLSGESAPRVTSTCSQERAVPISSGISHTYKHIHTFVHSLIMVMDSTRQSSDEDAGAREMNHFAQVVFHTERNQTSEASWKAARQTCNILQPTQHNSGLKFSWYSGAQRDVLSSTTHLLQQLSQNTSYPWHHSARQDCLLFGGCFSSQHYFLPYNAPSEYLMVAGGTHQKSSTSAPRLTRTQPWPKFKMPLKQGPQICGWNGVLVVCNR